ncbi:hypothetical protein Taro_051946 [Colocasia esculenta]|uniref:Alpha-carbonic anhydrase domain-containing protein n=1 Tax=Colocasia esculenta TaxID=4460 RepID=A0A843XHX3_COLES|nr:hypothetical protein [Colocasia esculenta]
MPYLPSGEASSSDPIYSHNRPPTPTIATAASVAPTGRRAQDKDTVLGRLPPSGRKLLRGHMDLGKLAVFSVAAVAVFVWHVGPVMCEEVENEREFSYESGAENGPEHWGDIHKDWEACGKGRMQSPIDLSDERVQVVEHLGRLRRAYRPAHATMMNRGHDIMLKWAGGAGAIWINGTEYVLKQMHWHSPSEHTIDGKRYAMETHMVHESADNRIAVVGILYTFGRPDSFLTEVTLSLSKIVKPIYLLSLFLCPLQISVVHMPWVPHS